MSKRLKYYRINYIFEIPMIERCPKSYGGKTFENAKTLAIEKLDDYKRDTLNEINEHMDALESIPMRQQLIQAMQEPK